MTDQRSLSDQAPATTSSPDQPHPKVHRYFQRNTPPAHARTTPNLQQRPMPVRVVVNGRWLMLQPPVGSSPLWLDPQESDRLAHWLLAGASEARRHPA
jgi:hypothetical protein